jgi:hypothetical protein
MNNYTDSQLKTILQFIDKKDVDKIEYMSFGTYTSLSGDKILQLISKYKIVWLYDNPYQLNLIPKDLLI